ncbi:DegV family protein [Heyndrickxia sporothermodurans]|uniref:DegV family protein n=1 Tax=Heyndrickxia sporothermodurans TaxID=46224 RepID=UPI002DBDFF56|nr:DegV family protein [Heyndrickxia sporothermodurans]MEB6548489.1 DegV family protein [Heyndrickxia sporothermodurans]MED3651820.1 DegV family protein [Heyndrickxia sporothermodurans]MED3652963.1 DegV family protein [Heyndrickxia sporothermodurans]MED3697155.1 DegV family protein [Heyndrickxia sporothermodurans]MED3781685.1 DegV family protein [Heyndrickxia sporothermodurans]
MRKIKIVTDSTVDMSNELIERYGIEVVPLSLFIDGESYLDRVDITPIEFIHKMSEAKELPKSSQPPVGVFLELYDRLGEDGYDVLSIHMSSGLSGTVNAAENAAALSKANVKVVDSVFISKALSFQVVEAAVMAEEGKTVDEILIRLEKIRSQTRLYVVVEKLDNLVKGGRIGKGKALIGSLLHIKPIASLEDGVYNPIANVRSHTQVIKHLVKSLVEDAMGKTIKKIGIAHAESYDLVSKLKNAIFTATGFENIEIEITTPIISTHTGAGAIGFMYYTE